MKKRKRLTRREKIVVRQAVLDAEKEGKDHIMIDTGIRTVRVDLENGKAILPSGKSFDTDAERIC